MNLKTLVLCLILSMAIKSFAQEPDNHKNEKALKLNINYIQQLDNPKTFLIGNLAPSFLLKDRRENFHEIELNRFEISKIYPGNSAANNYTSLALRYQYDYVILQYKRFTPYIGLSLLQMYSKEDRSPSINNSFRRKIIYYENHMSLIPGCFYKISKNIVLDLSVPVNFFQYIHKKQRVYNPIIPYRQQVMWENEIDSTPFNEFHIRFGIGYKL